LLAELQLDHILAIRDPTKRLSACENPPPDIDSAYLEVIDRINMRPGDLELAMNILGWLFYTPRLVRMDELREALSVGQMEVISENVLHEDYVDENDTDGDNDGDEEISGKDSEIEDPDDHNTNGDCELDPRGNRMLKPNQVIECCRGLVIFEESTGFIQFSHETVRTFIESKLQQKLPPTINLAKTCLTYLEFDTFNQVCDIVSMKECVQRYKFGGYAAQFWGVYTKGETENSPVVRQKNEHEFRVDMSLSTDVEACPEFQADWK